MLRSEFDRECRTLDKNYNSASVTDEMFDIINFVYTWYPSLSDVHGKQQIASLYVTYGFIIIQDMHERAREHCRVDHLVSEAKNKLEELKDRVSQLSSGRAIQSGTGWTYSINCIPQHQ